MKRNYKGSPGNRWNCLIERTGSCTHAFCLATILFTERRNWETRINELHRPGIEPEPPATLRQLNGDRTGSRDSWMSKRTSSTKSSRLETDGTWRSRHSGNMNMSSIWDTGNEFMSCYDSRTMRRDGKLGYWENSARWMSGKEDSTGTSEASRSSGTPSTRMSTPGAMNRFFFQFFKYYKQF